MENLKEQGGQRDLNRYNVLRENLDASYKEEEMFWSHKARIQWLHDRDKNTKFFYAGTIHRRRINILEQLKKEMGGWCEDEEKIVGEVLDYYFKLFTSVDVGRWEEKFSGITATITDSMNSNLIKPVEDSEIRNAVFSMNPNKAPEMDVMTLFFFQSFWNIVQSDICNAVKSFY